VPVGSGNAEETNTASHNGSTCCWSATGTPGTDPRPRGEVAV